MSGHWRNIWNRRVPQQVPSLLRNVGPIDLMPPQQRRAAEPSASAANDGPLAKLPAEIIMAITEHLDFNAYMNLRRANLRVFSILLKYQSSIVRDLWHRKLGDIYNEAVSTMRSQQWVQQSQITTPGLRGWLGNHFMDEPEPIENIWESHEMNVWHFAVEFLVDDMFRVCRRIPWLAEDLVRHPFTAIERDRFRRNLYRLEFLSRLFGISVHYGPRFPSEIIPEIVRNMKAIFTHGELAQMYAAGSILEGQLCRAMQPFDPRPQGADWYEDHAQHVLSRGMLRTYRALAAPPMSAARERAIFGREGPQECHHFISEIFFQAGENGDWYGSRPRLVNDPYSRVVTLPMLHRDPGHDETAWRNVSQSSLGEFMSKLHAGAVLLDLDRWERLEEEDEI